MYPDQSNLTCLISFGVLSFLVASSTNFSKACNSSITISGILDPYSVRALLLFAILCSTLFFRFLQKTTIYVHENQCPPSKDLQNALQQQRRIPLFFLVQQQLEVNINYYIDISICLGHPKHNCFVSFLLTSRFLQKLSVVLRLSNTCNPVNNSIHLNTR